MDEGAKADRVVLEIAMAQPGWDGRFMSLAYEIRDRIQSLSDEGKSIDTGTGGDSANLWLWNDGREYFINIRLSNKMLLDQGKPIPFTTDWWRPIETAPVPPREVLRFDHWPCLLQDKKGNVVGGYAAYVRSRGGGTADRAHKKKPPTYSIQWYAGNHPEHGMNRVFKPVLWMPMPPPETVLP